MRRFAVPLAALLAALLASSAPAAAQKAAKAPAAKAKGGSAMLPGGDSNKPITIEADKLDYFDKERKLIYTGNAVAVQGDTKIKATILTILLAPKAAAGTTQPAQSTSTGQVQKMLAQGPVTVVQRDQIGTGDNGVYDKVQNTYVLTGNVTLTQGTNVTKGDQVVYNLKTGQANVTGARVSSMFNPEEDTDSKAAAAPTPPAAKKSAKAKSKRSGV